MDERTLTQASGLEARFREYVARLPAVICEIAADGTVLFTNDAVTSITGYWPNELVGRNWWEVFFPGELRVQVDELYQRFQSGDVANYDLTIVARDGLRRVLSWNSCNRYLPNGGLESIVGFGVDVTGRVRAEKTLRESEERYRMLAEAAQDFIFLADREGRLRYVNAAAARQLDRTPEEIVGRVLEDVFPPDVARIQRSNGRKVIETGQAVSVELELPFADRTVLLDTLLAPIRDEAGEVTALMGISRDISPRKRGEAALRESIERLERIMEGTIQAMALTVEMRDPYTAGHQKRVAELASAIAREMGLAEEQVGVVRMAGLVHDIGKICVPAEILSKPGPINDYEFSLIKSHPKTAYEILNTVEFPWPIAKVVHQHHEMMDGSGYPNRLSGDEIILEARILAVSDVVEAMASHRPYRPALGIDRALEEVAGNRNKLYDPAVSDACLRVFSDKGFRFGNGGEAYLGDGSFPAD